MAGRGRRQEKRGEGGEVLLPRYTQCRAATQNILAPLSRHRVDQGRVCDQSSTSTARAPRSKTCDHNFRSGQAVGHAPMASLQCRSVAQPRAALLAGTRLSSTPHWIGHDQTAAGTCGA